MFRELINLNNYFFNPFALPSFIGGILLLIIGIFIFYQKRDLFGVVCLFWMCAGGFVWLFFVGLVLMCKSDQLAFFIYNTIDFFGVCLISVSGYFLSLLWNKELLKKQIGILVAGYAAMILFYFGNLFFHIVCVGIYSYPWGKYPQYGIGGLAFLAVWGFYFVLTTINYFSIYKKSEGLVKRQIKLVLIGVMIVYLGTIDYLAAFGWNVLPLGSIPATVFFLFMSYAIVRYQVFEIQTAVHKTILWMITSFWLFIPGFFLFKLILPYLKKLDTIWFTVVELLMFYVFLNYYKYFQPKIDNLFRRRKYDYQKVLGAVGEKIGNELDSEVIIHRLFKEFHEILYIKNGILLMHDPITGGFKELESFGYDKLPNGHEQGKYSLDSKNKLYQWFLDTKKSIDNVRLDIEPSLKPIKTDAMDWLKRLSCEIVIPIVIKERVDGVIGLGKKEDFKNYNSTDINLLEKLGRLISVSLMNALNHEEIVKKREDQERLKKEMEIAERIQTSLVPKPPIHHDLEIAAVMRPAEEVGGDYYDVLYDNKNKMWFAIGDVTGHGVTPGLIMMMAQSSFFTAINMESEISPIKALREVNSILYENIINRLRESQNMTMKFLKYLGEGKFIYANAAHPDIIIYRNRSKTCEQLSMPSFFLGVMQDISGNTGEAVFTLEKDDILFLYTDGITESMHPTNEVLWGDERFKKLILECANMELETIRDNILKEALAWCGNRARDDMTMIIVKRK